LGLGITGASADFAVVGGTKLSKGLLGGGTAAGAGEGLLGAGGVGTAAAARWKFGSVIGNGAGAW
jgi:hypothetical protein